MTTKHTPGPWHIYQGGNIGDDGFTIAPVGEGGYVAEFWPPIRSERKQPEMFANARLIAAAPDLLEACKRLAMERHTHRTDPNNEHGCLTCGQNFRSEVHYRVGESSDTDLELARAAIAKAQGGAQ
jgi:hypothetical protein